MIIYFYHQNYVKDTAIYRKGISCFLVCSNINIRSAILSFGIYNIVLLTVVAMLCNILLEFIHLR